MSHSGLALGLLQHDVLIATGFYLLGPLQASWVPVPTFTLPKTITTVISNTTEEVHTSIFECADILTSALSGVIGSEQDEIEASPSLSAPYVTPQPHWTLGLTTKARSLQNVTKYTSSLYEFFVIPSIKAYGLHTVLFWQRLRKALDNILENLKEQKTLLQRNTRSFIESFLQELKRHIEFLKYSVLRAWRSVYLHVFATTKSISDYVNKPILNDDRKQKLYVIATYLAIVAVAWTLGYPEIKIVHFIFRCYMAFRRLNASKRIKGATFWTIMWARFAMILESLLPFWIWTQLEYVFHASVPIEREPPEFAIDNEVEEAQEDFSTNEDNNIEEEKMIHPSTVDDNSTSLSRKESLGSDREQQVTANANQTKEYGQTPNKNGKFETFSYESGKVTKESASEIRHWKELYDKKEFELRAKVGEAKDLATQLEDSSTNLEKAKDSIEALQNFVLTQEEVHNEKVDEATVALESANSRINNLERQLSDAKK
ncbi:hypothetical protein BS50DRAFT_587399 [Corynespora cassiicola Philippines]|uniref:Uncharacterized protein n=1 Tax=Corynespora cassiicola Philippines TaxID=1448308 RepID=A0A2T2NSZ6_CORCC|nr:hypothetical protein BS50DRAFT_587399 [Corynespora cassiicola Philippines]